MKGNLDRARINRAERERQDGDLARRERAVKATAACADRKRRSLENRRKRGQAGKYTVHELELLAVTEIVAQLQPYHERALFRLSAVAREDATKFDKLAFMDTCDDLLHVKIPGEFALKLHRALMKGRRHMGKLSGDDWGRTRKVLLAQHHAWVKKQRINEAYEEGKL